MDLPADWTGVAWHWPQGDFVECRDHVEANPRDPSSVEDLVQGTLLFGTVTCDQSHDSQ